MVVLVGGDRPRQPKMMFPLIPVLNLAPGETFVTHEERQTSFRSGTEN
jgi:hypothetical protein